MTIREAQQQLIEDFDLFDDWTDKYEYIISMGKNLPLIDDALKTDEYRIKGCQSQVWLDAGMNEQGNLIFTADSDAIITKGIIAMLIKVLDNHSPMEVAQADMGFINEIGLKDHLSPTRANGLAMMVKKLKMYGLAFAAKSN